MDLALSLLVYLGVLHNSIEGAKRRSKVIESGCRDELVVHANDLGGLCVSQGKLKVNNVLSLDLQVSCNQVCERCKVFILDLEDVVLDFSDFRVKKILDDCHSDDWLEL